MRLDRHEYGDMVLTVPNRDGDTISTPEQRVIRAWTFRGGDLDIEVTDGNDNHLASITVTAEGDVDITYLAYKEAP